MTRELPAILDAAARAGSGGLDVDRLAAAELETCRAWRLPLEVRGRRAFLADDPDALVPAWIVLEAPPGPWGPIKPVGFLEIGSTNDEALQRARRGAEPGTIVCAEKQTAGRGRKGRVWESPAREGLYFSLVVAPRQPLAACPLLSQAASLALAAAIEDEIEGSAPALDLKWPNDVLARGRKAAGILLETVAAEARAPSAVVVGVGVNVGPAAVPDWLRDSAISLAALAGAAVPRRRLLVRFLERFGAWCARFDAGELDALREAWMGRSTMCRGAAVRIEGEGRVREGITCGLTPAGALRVRVDGREEVVLAGDVSVRTAGSAG